jgi:hypothetical protein
VDPLLHATQVKQRRTRGWLIRESGNH